MANILLLIGAALSFLSAYINIRNYKSDEDKDWKPARFISLYSNFFLIAAATLYHSTPMLWIFSFMTAYDLFIIIKNVYKEHLEKEIDSLDSTIEYFDSEDGREIIKILDEHKQKGNKLNRKDAQRIIHEYYEEKAKNEIYDKGGDKEE